MNDTSRMRVVYELFAELAADPERVEKAQALTKNVAKPNMGLKGTHGLFGSREWWDNINSGRIKKRTVRGPIKEVYFAGQDARWGDQVNSFRLALGDGALKDEGIYAARKEDRRLFKPGADVQITYILDELKRQPARDGSTNYLEIVYEMAVSEE